MPDAPAAPGALLVIVNPTALRGRRAAAFAAVLGALPAGAAVVHETAGDGSDGGRLAAALRTQRPRLVAAAGGDGTVHAVATALLALPATARPALALLPLGTANNVARSLGLPHLTPARPVIRAAVGALRHGRPRPLDVGCCNGGWFVGSCAAGMDAAILATRNRWHRRWAGGGRRGGYALYLASCAANLVRHRPVAAELAVDGGAPRPAALHNLLVLNTALYAGEFRFDATDHSGDGRLDLLHFASAPAYVRGFVAAWQRHLRTARGRRVHPAPLQRITALHVRTPVPLPLQLDGEEAPAAHELAIRVEPAALRVHLPPADQ